MEKDTLYVSESIATKYAEFCVICDREKIPLICLEDFIDRSVSALGFLEGIKHIMGWDGSDAKSEQITE